MNPQVDVLIPVYEVEQFVAKCLTSVLSQRYHPLRVVLVDDASPDNSIAIAKQVIKEHNPYNHTVEIISFPTNKGIGIVRRELLSKTKGEYTLFLDSDDYWDNENVVAEWVAIAEKGSYEVVFSDYCHEYPLQRKNKVAHVTPRASGREMAYALLYGQEASYFWNKLFLTETLRRYNHLLKEGRNFWEDVAVTIPLLYRAERVGYYPKVSVHYQHHGNTQYTAQVKPSYIASLADLLSDFEKEEGFLQNDNHLEVAYNYLKMRIFTILAQLPFKYYNQLRQPIFNVKKEFLPNTLGERIKYTIFSLVHHRYTAWIGCLLFRLFLYLYHHFKKKEVYKA